MDKEKLLQDYIFVAKYAQINNGKKEIWEQAVSRVMSMHENYLINKLGINSEEIMPYAIKVKAAYLKQEILGAQRALQWGGEQLLKHQFRLYNCAASYVDRIEFFNELMYVLLTGAGVGYSVQDHHVAQLPSILNPLRKNGNIYIVPDSIEGWSDAIKVLFESHTYKTEYVEFDYTKIRKKGSSISGGFIAPGYKPLEKALELIRNVLTNASGRQLVPLETHEIACIIADAVISGGVRRSALVSLFTITNESMLTCKTGDWLYNKPYLGRANNSAVILPNTPKTEYEKAFNFIKEFGEPGFAFLPDKEIVFNPCFEVGMYPTLLDKDGKKIGTGFSVCNLTEINGKLIKTEEDFYNAAENAAILGTIQATYTDFKYMSYITRNIVERDALIGVGITGMAESPNILFNPEFQRNAAEIVVNTNKKLSKILGIHEAARTTVIKPSGTSSLLLGTSSGIHPFHSYRMIRNVQANKSEQAGNILSKINPHMVTPSVWSKDDNVISFPLEKELDHIVTKTDVKAIELLKLVKLTYQNWISTGNNSNQAYQNNIPKNISHNVSNTITVEDNEWDSVMDYIWDNRSFFSGISLIPSSGDLDYPQAPFVEVLDEVELAEFYGPASILAGGLNVDGVHAFGDLWVAIDTALDKGENLEFKIDTVLDLIKNHTVISPSRTQFEFTGEGLLMTDVNTIIAYQKDKLLKREDWVRRFKNFANKYLSGDLALTGRCLKQVSIFHQWNQLQYNRTIYWDEYNWDTKLKSAGGEIAEACHGGNCEINI